MGGIVKGVAKAVSGVAKGVGKVVKGAAKAVTGVVKGVTKAFKKIVKTPLFGAALLSAAVYFGGAALGQWNSGFASIDGALLSSAGSASTAQTVLASGVPTTPSGIISGAASTAPAAAASGSVAAAPLAAAPTATALAPSVAPAAAAASAPVAAASAPVAGTVSNAGLISQAISKIGPFAKSAAGFVKANPIASAMALNAAASAFSPDEIDVMEEQERIRNERLRAQQQNLNVGDIDLNIRPGNRILYDNQGRQVYSPSGGLIGSRLNRGSV